MKTAKFGSLSLPDIAVFAPAWYNGDAIEIRDTVSNRELTWVVVDGKFISSRVILTNVSWFELHEQGLIMGKEITIDGWRYLCRSLDAGDSRTVPHEWDSILRITGYDALVWYGDTCKFWCQGRPKSKSSRVTQGGGTINGWNLLTGEAKEHDLGFRPVLEPLDHDWAITKDMLGKKVTVFLPTGCVEGVVTGYTDYDLILDSPVLDYLADGRCEKWFAADSDGPGYVSREAIMHIQK